ncbi:MAG: beta-lactamase family protein [Gammaproteobacteria bacterium]|nr:beta-lactamase family protein [Gammaproteobacteria bacterium]
MRRAIIILWLTLLPSCNVLDGKHHAEKGPSSSVEDPVFDPQLSDVLQKALEKAARFQEADGISASLFISDRCHWQGSTGVTGQDPNTAVESDMLFGFGSITKTFVAAVVLQLAEENRLGLEDPLEKWLEKYPNIDSKITIRQLLNHASGLYSYTSDESFWSDLKANLNRVWLPEELLKYVALPADTQRDIPRYSNTNYILLGMIIEAVTGNSLERELQNRIIGPLHLDSTYLPKTNFNPERWANSTALSSSLYSGVWAAGAIASTSSDIAKWSHALYSGSFLQATSMESMLATEVRGHRQGLISMGLGVAKLGVEGQIAWGHGGWLGPFVSRTFYLPKFELSVAYSSSGAHVSRQSIPGRHLLRAYISNQPDDISRCFDSSGA